MLKDYYKILGIEKEASTFEVKRAYRDMAKKYHPDVNSTPEAKEKFILMTEAYEILAEPKKRHFYDLHFGAQGKMSRAYRESRTKTAAYNEWLASARKRAADRSQMAYDEFLKSPFYKRASIVTSGIFLGMLGMGVFLILYPVFRYVTIQDVKALYGMLYLFPIGTAFILSGIIGIKTK